MFRILYSDTRKIFSLTGFRICLIANLAYQLFSMIILVVISRLAFGMQMDADGVFFQYTGFAAILVTASTLFTTTCDFSDGFMRNKLISGVRRYEIMLSAVIGGLLQGFIHAAVSSIFAVVFTPIFCTGFTGYTISEAAEYWLIITLASMAIGVFSTVLIMVLGGGKASYVVGLVISISMSIFSLRVIDQLFPSKGNCSLTGIKLMVYRFFDRFVPYMYFASRPHYEFSDYLMGSLGLIILSTIIGILIFNRKELN